MKALTVRQPWAGTIAHQSKTVENRSWKLPAKHEGVRILIHWTLADVTALPEPVPAKGALGFWTPSEETVNAALRQDTAAAW